MSDVKFPVKLHDNVSLGTQQAQKCLDLDKDCKRLSGSLSQTDQSWLLCDVQIDTVTCSWIRIVGVDID